MPDYDIDRLGDRAFEQLVVSLAAQVLGPGVRAFGDGPDGGREATFEGPINWAATTSGTSGMWDGYTVLQAKFHYHPRTPKDNAAWLKNQINGEIDRWVSAMKEGTRTRSPQYLIFASNVRLSSRGVAGGIDTLDAELHKRIRDKNDPLSQLKIRDFRIWHADQIHRFLDGADAVRRAFPALLTVGDVLARIGDNTSGPTIPDLGARMRLHAAQCLRNEHWIRFSEAGATSGQKSRIEDLAVDLPGTWVDDRNSRIQVRDTATVKQIVEHADAVLRRDLTDRVKRPHWVIIGGPGQGKSTLSSLITQAYRAALLARGEMTPDVSAIVDATRERLAYNSIPEPRNLRWPMRVDLAHYAETLAATPAASLLTFLSSEISSRTDALISPNDLRIWLRAWPWVVVLDGLDEVSDARRRRVLLERLTDFIETADSSHADLLLVATTRPLGYDERFDTEFFNEITLKRLTSCESETFALQLVNVRLSNDPDLKKTVIKRLETALADPRTNRLMQTPLQITIMSFIVESYGTLPLDRYGLFSLYYRSVYQREVDKPGTSIARILNEHKSDINYLHSRVALHLHVATEDADSTSTMPIAQLERIVRTRLEEQHYSASQVDTIAEQLIRAATHRLVLLVPDGDRIGFEIRSLQELMAANAMTAGPDQQALDLLELTIPHPHWRNVWLLAAGRLFKEREYVHQHLEQVLGRGDMNGSPLLRIIPSGPVVACNVLDDGFASQAPRTRRKYIDRALTCLNYPPSERQYIEIAGSLARACTTAEDRDYLFATLTSAMASGGMPQIHAYLIMRSLPVFDSTLWRRYELIKQQHELDPAVRQLLILHHREGRFSITPEDVGQSQSGSMVDLAAALLAMNQEFEKRDHRNLTQAEVAMFRSILQEFERDVSSLSRIAEDSKLEATLSAVLESFGVELWDITASITSALRPFIVRRPVGGRVLDAVVGGPTQ
ncbi:NACHT domain-containing protein [Nocardia gamkensis]|uniref:NACHT domain-containing protein n=1 Tax=Nocardia gamkensis TaxID=352869 RepID=UPI0036F001B8